MVSDWALEEAAEADFGDERLDRRFALLVSDFGNRPNLSIPAGCRGRAEMEAAYRFTDNPRVTLEKILRPHARCTMRRVAEHKVALFVQDTTELDLTRPERQVAGAGPLDSPVRRGVYAHVVHAFAPDGTPLGTLSTQITNRVDKPKAKTKRSKVEKEKRRAATPIEQKESNRWLQGFRSVRQAAGEAPDTQCIGVSDSESDVYELFVEPRAVEGGGQIDLLVRACRDRLLEVDDEQASDTDASAAAPPPRYPRQAVLATPVRYGAQVLMRGRKTALGLELKGRRQPRESREAKLEVRAASVKLRPPHRPDRTLAAVTLNVVLVSEVDPPAGETPVEWLLLTTLPIDTLEQVKAVVEYYCARWHVEIFFRTLKSGCRIEARRFESIERVERALGLYLIAAWRTLFVTWLGRACPETDCEALFEPSEWKAVWAATQRKKPPKKKPKLREIVTLIAELGGYVPRAGSEPGAQTLWIGLQRMYDLALAWDAFGPEAKMKRG